MRKLVCFVSGEHGEREKTKERKKSRHTGSFEENVGVFLFLGSTAAKIVFVVIIIKTRFLVPSIVHFCRCKYPGTFNCDTIICFLIVIILNFHTKRPFFDRWHINGIV